MREIDVSLITEAVSRACISANKVLPDDLAELIKKSADTETDDVPKDIMCRLCDNLCAAKELLLLDEPVTGLDPVVTAEFYRLIKKLNRDSGIAVIMVSHDIECAVENANKILHLGERGVEFFGTTEDYLKSDAGRRFAGRGRNDD